MNRPSSQAAFTLAVVVACVLWVWGLPGCPGSTPAPPATNDNAVGGTTTFSEDATLASLAIAAGDSASVENDAVITVTGNVTIDGSLRAAAGRLTLRVDGGLIVNGSLEATGPASSDEAADTPLDAQTSGIYIIVGSGEVTFAPNAEVLSTGPVVITDDESVLNETPADLYAEVEDVSGDDLPTFVPLPPDNEAFDGDAKAVSMASPIVEQGSDGLPVTVSGVWPPGGMVVPGDRPIIILRFNGSRPLNLDGWTVNGPAAPPGADGAGDPGESATGRSGKNGLRLNILNNGGPINIANSVVFNLADGGDGGDADTVCADATGGPGGLSGNLRMSAAGGIDLTGGTLTINPGRGGNGGSATVAKGAPGADGCPGEAGDGGSARGGDGAANRKRLFARGNVTGLENVTLGAVEGGAGGPGTAEVCDGGNGTACCDGGPGGDASATGGKGGDASLDVSGLPVAVGEVIGGDGGDATATGGNGGDGGDCKFGDAGNGGAGGGATATGGAGGAATNATGGAAGGAGGDATATGGSGGAGGDSGIGIPGEGGAGGSATASAGIGGLAAAAGESGSTDASDGPEGPPGGALDVVLYCLGLADFLNSIGGDIPPGERQGPVTSLETGEEVGVIDIEFVADETASYQSSDTPVPHVGLDGGTLSIDVSSLRLDAGAVGAIGGVRIEPLFGNGLSEAAPLVIEALDANGQVIDTQSLAELPNNFADPENPESVDVVFEIVDGASEIRIVAPPGSFVTIIRLYLLDP